MKKLFFISLFSLFFSNACLAENDLNYYWDLGTWFGGDTIAHNPDGDNYKAGSGAVLGLGFEWNFSKKYILYSRNSIGYRYQGAKSGSGGNRGIVLESAIIQKIGLFNYGVGLHGDLNNYVKDYYGNKTELKNEIGPLFIIEYMAFRHSGFSLKYHALDYESKDGRAFSGGQLGLFLSGTF